MVHTQQKIIEQLFKFFTPNPHRNVITAQNLRGSFGKRSFVIARTGILIKGQGHRTQLRAKLGSQGRNHVGINPGREEYPHRYV